MRTEKRGSALLPEAEELPRNESQFLLLIRTNHPLVSPEPFLLLLLLLLLSVLAWDLIRISLPGRINWKVSFRIPWEEQDVP